MSCDLRIACASGNPMVVEMTRLAISSTGLLNWVMRASTSLTVALQILLRDHPIHESEGASLFGRHGLARQDQFVCPFGTDHLWEHDGRKRREGPHLHLGLRETR